jgi:hypothetical protein
VFCTDCDAGDGWRLTGHAGWSIPADRAWIPAPLRPLWLRLYGRGFRDGGRTEADELRHGDGLWGSAELAWRCDACGPVHEVYVRGHGGRVPLPLRERRVVTAGVSLFF